MSNQVTVQKNLGQRAIRLALCASVAGMALASQTAHAVVVVTNTSIVVPFNINGVYINVVTGAATATTAAGYDINPYFRSATTATPSFRLLVPSTGGMVGAAGIATPLTFGAVVGASSAYITGTASASASASVTTPGTSYYGFQFVNEATTLTNYGYVAVQQTSALPAADSVTILGYAYENSGTSITVAPLSAVPEPASMALMFGGLLAFGAFAKQRKAGLPEHA